MSDFTPYAGLLAEIKSRIRTAQTRAVLAVNGELIHLYWQIGALLDARQAHQHGRTRQKCHRPSHKSKAVSWPPCLGAITCSCWSG